MQNKKLIDTTRPRIINFNNDYWVCKNDFRDEYFNYYVNFSEYLTYFLLRQLNIDIPDSMILPIDNNNYNIVKYIPDAVEYRVLAAKERKEVVEQFKEIQFLLLTPES